MTTNNPNQPPVQVPESTGAPGSNSGLESATNIPIQNGSESKARLEPNMIAELCDALNRVVSSDASEQESRSAFRTVCMNSLGVVGVGHVLTNAAGKWDLDPDHSTGRVPRRNDFVSKYGKTCNSAIESGSVLVESFLGLQAIFVPIRVTGSQPEVFLFTVEAKKLSTTLSAADLVSDYFQKWLKEKRYRKSRWQTTSLAAVIDLVSKIQCNTTVKSASETIVNELVRYLGCGPVALATTDGKTIKLEAISGQAELKRSSKTFQFFETALSESQIRKEISTWPCEDPSGILLLAHQQLATELHQQSVVSLPLKTPDGVSIGSVILTGDRSLIQSNRLLAFMDAMAPRAAGAMEVVQRAQQSRLRRMTSSLEKQFHKVQNQIWLGVLAVLICALLIPTPYRVRCNCELVSTSPRVAVAPFEGIVEKGFVRAGDIVKKGQLLGRMDGSRLRYELASINADLFRAQKEREVELARHNIPASLLAELDAKSLLSQKNLLEYEQQHIEIRSQIDGIVLNGSLEESEGASVGLGDVLFEVGPVDQLKLKVFIPAEEIASVGIGRPLRIWMDGFEHKRIVGHIQKIAPQSELKDAKNVFVAELTVDNSDLSFRPGMKGRVRIDCQHHRICWNLFHKPWNFLRSRLAWW